MALSLDPATKVITVPQGDLTLVSGTLYSMNTDDFRKDVTDLLASEPYIWMDDAFIHNTAVTVAGTTFARTIEFINGYSITFSPDTLWSARLEGSNNNIFDIEGGILNQNSVQVIPTNSAGLIGAKQLEDQSFTDSRIWIDTIAGQSGVSYPIGTPGSPSDNLADSQSIIAVRTLPKRIHLRGVLPLTGTDDIGEYDIQGTDSSLAEIVLGGASVDNAHITHCEVSGSCSGEIHMGFCDVGALPSFRGTMHDCTLGGVVTLTSGSDQYKFNSCESGVAGTATAVIDVNSVSNIDLQVRDYDGGIELRNVVSGNVSIDLNSGRVVIDSTCTGGTIVVGGTGRLTDNGTMTVEDSSLVAGDQTKDVWTRLGLNPDDSITDTTSGIDSNSGDIEITRTGDGVTSSTLTRQ